MSISRREFLELSLVGSLLTACNRFGIDPTKISIPTGTPTPPIPTEATPTTRPTETRLPETNYVDNRLVRYGYELADWTVNGQRMVKKFPEIAQAVELLTDKKNPAEIISFIELPITFDFIDINNEFSNLHFLGNAISENQAIMLLTDDSGNVVSAKVWGDIFLLLICIPDLRIRMWQKCCCTTTASRFLISTSIPKLSVNYWKVNMNHLMSSVLKDLK